MRKEDKFNIKGHLDIVKIYPDGREELHWSDHNVITSGMGWGLAHLFSELGSSSILDFQIRYAQLGVSGSTDYGVSTYKLNSSLSYAALSGQPLPTSQNSQYQNGFLAGFEGYIVIPSNNIIKVSPTSVRYHIIIPQDALNNSYVFNEIGLFMKNPRGQPSIESVLVAYRSFTNLSKTNEYALLFRWTLYF
jgi:hypothetical protein